MNFQPFKFLEAKPRLRTIVGIGLALIFAAIFFRLNAISRPLNTMVAPRGVLSLYFAYDAVDANQIIQSWRTADVIEAARQNLRLDYLFLVVYSTFFAFLIFLTAAGLKNHARWYKVGRWLMYGQWIAALLDALENTAIWLMLNQAPVVNGFPQAAYWLAAGKWLLILAGWGYLLGGGLLRWGLRLYTHRPAITALSISAGDTKSLKDVREQEQTYLKRRRELAFKSLGEETARRWADKAVIPQTTIGLTLSGGGMRSATFNLGIVQALARLGILPAVDYLSTVSGGGYMGTSLSALLSMRTIGLPVQTEVWAAPDLGTPVIIPKAINADIIGKEWWRITYDGAKSGWVTAHPDDMDQTDTQLLVYENPQSSPDPVAVITGAQITSRERWYRVRYKTDAAGKTFNNGWIKTGPNPVTPFTFDTTPDKFPLNPAIPAFDPAPNTAQARNHQLYHMRLNGNIIAPRRGLLKQDTLRLVGAAVSGISRMLFIFGVLFLILAALHYVLAGLLAPDISQKLVFAEKVAAGSPQTVTVEVGLAGAPAAGQVTAKLSPAAPSPGPTPPIVPFDEWFTVIFLQKDQPPYAAEPPPAETTTPPVYWIYLTTGALGALLTYLYIRHFYVNPDVGPQPDAPGLSAAEAKAKFILRDCTIFSLLLLILLSLFLKTGFMVTLLGGGQSTQLYWLWMPAVFLLGHWFVTTFIYLFLFQDKLWEAEFRSIIAGWQGVNSYGLLAGILFAVLALPYYLRLPGEGAAGTNVTLLVLSAAISGAWSYFLAGDLAGQKSTGLLNKVPGGVKKALLNILAATLVVSIGLLFGTLFERMPGVELSGSTAKTEVAFYFLTWGAIVLAAIFLIAYLMRKIFRQSQFLKSLFDGLFRLILSLLFLYLLAAIVFFTLGWFNLPDAIYPANQTGLPFSLFDLVGAFLAFPIMFGLIFLILFAASLEAMLVQGRVMDWTSLNDVRGWGRSIWLLALISLGIFGVWVYQYWIGGFNPGPPWDDTQWLSVLMIGVFAGLMLVLISQYVNLNRISFHYFYRDRLIDVFFKTNRVENNPEQVIPVRDQSDILVQDLNPDHTPAPYHLIVSTLNLPGSKSLTYKDSQSEPFIFSRYFCGSDKTSYFPSHLYQGGLTRLARAAAISGAAFSSTLGQYTFFAQALVMTMFDVRLGYWMDNPERYRVQAMLARSFNQNLTQLESNTTMTHESNAFWAKYLWYELSGTAHSREKLINLSDGGHTDNLGLYPLLQRRCRLIIAGDAGCDADFTFDDLGRVIRRIYSEENVVIDINLDGLKPGADGVSRQHGAVGKITYPPLVPDGEPEIGWLIYLKPTMTGDEEGSIKSYWWNHQADQFPHQTTADQFYDENQFEAYRHLGEHTVRQMLHTLNQFYLTIITGMPAEYDRLYKFGQKLGKDEGWLSQKFAGLQMGTVLSRLAPEQLQQQIPPLGKMMEEQSRLPDWLMTPEPDRATTSLPASRKPPGLDAVYEKMVDQYIKKLRRAGLVSEKIMADLLAEQPQPLLEILKISWSDLFAGVDLLDQALDDWREAVLSPPPLGQ